MLATETMELRHCGWSKWRRWIFLSFAVFATQLVGCATNPLQNARFWRIEQCAGIASLAVRFTRPDGSTLATIPRANCEALARAEGKVEGVAGYHANQIWIADLDTPNAFATVGKDNLPVIVVTMGMLNALESDEAAWAGLLGHEIAHHVRNHGAGRKEAKEGARATGQALGNVIAQLIPGMGGFVAGNAANFATANALYGAYTRPQEAEADDYGLRWMVAAGYDPRGMERLFNVLGRQSGGLPGFLSTHPGAEDRAQKVRDSIASTAPSNVPTAGITGQQTFPTGTWKGLSRSTVTGAAVSADLRLSPNGEFSYTSAYGAEMRGTLRFLNSEIVGTGTMKVPEQFRGQRLPAMPDGSREAEVRITGALVTDTRIQGSFSGGGDTGNFEFTKYE